MKRNSFAYRHIGPKAIDVDQMLSTIGVDSIDTLIDQTVPAAIRADKLNLPHTSRRWVS